MLSWYELSMMIISGISIISQIYIIYLIRFKSPAQMDSYRRYLYMTTIFDLLFTITLGIIYAPAGFTPVFAARIDGLGKYFGRKFCEIVGWIIFYSAVEMLAFQTMSLMFRFAITHQNNEVFNVFMTKKVQAALIFLGQVIGISLSCGFYAGIMGAEDSKIQIPLWANRTEPEINPNDMMIFFNFGTPILYKYIISVLVIFILSEVFCILLFVLILKNLRQNSHTFSPKTYRLHLTFTLLLIIQIFSPIVYMFIPVLMGILGTLLKARPKKLVIDIALLVIMFYGLSNSLLTIIFISPYRKHTFNVLIFPWLKPLLKIVGFNSSRVHVLPPTVVTPNPS